MLRGLLVVLLTLGALAAAVLGLYSLWHQVGKRGMLTERHWAAMEVDAGNLHLAFARTSNGYAVQRRKSVHLGALGTFRSASGKSGKWRYHSIGAPLWPVVALLITYPAWAFIRGPLLRRIRRSKGLCGLCGYDLTGNQTGICPECGVTIPP
jgi:hypothetical protein